ncbi:Chromo domain/shadow [Lasallia pustulata]|uniref:Chromo domain/shadow n=1 Tax=Lasallia pustulata TaxID=136370 RepID=A0A1W5CTR2_9LECA|nr:Chromo domain/shadow [Lasallia pustulata]
MYAYHPEVRFKVEGDSRKEEVPAAKDRVKIIYDTLEALLQRWENVVKLQVKYYDAKHKPKTYNRRHGNKSAPILQPPELVSDKEEYEVKEILDKHNFQKEIWYEVKWKGWPEEYDQWIPDQDMEGVQELRRAYKVSLGDQRKKRCRKS